MRNRGERGERGEVGERGPKGDHGQHGEPGAEGSSVQGTGGTTGARGATGATGARGATGESSPYLSRNRTLAIFAFIVLAFTLLAYRTETNADRIQQSVYENCLTRAEVEDVGSDCERFR